jgi:hypothetical protein
VSVSVSRATCFVSAVVAAAGAVFSRACSVAHAWCTAVFPAWSLALMSKVLLSRIAFNIFLSTLVVEEVVRWGAREGGDRDWAFLGCIVT